MPAYNAEKTLLTAYDEVVAQGVADVGIVVDDCSNDGTDAFTELRVKSEEWEGERVRRAEELADGRVTNQTTNLV